MESYPSPQEFITILTSLLSSDNEVRPRAEQMLTDLTPHSSYIIPALISSLSQPIPEAARQMAAVCLQKAVVVPPKEGSGAKFALLSLDSALQEQMKKALLEVFVNESSMKVQRLIGYALSVIASQTVDEGLWNEFVPFLFEKLQNGTPLVKRAILNVLGQMSSSLESSLINGMPVLVQALLFSMSEEQEMDVRVGGVDTASKFILRLSDEKSLNQLKSLIPVMIRTLYNAVERKDKDNATSILANFIGLAEGVPEMIENDMPSLIPNLFALVNMPEIEEDLRFLAIELLISHAESTALKVKKDEGFIRNMLQILMNLLLKPPMMDDWGDVEEDEDEEARGFDVGREGLDRLALNLAGRKFDPIATEIVAQALNGSEWQQKNAGLEALALISEGCAKAMERNLAVIIQMVLTHAQDPSERVRWSALACLSQFCVDFAPGLQNTFHGIILERLMSALDDPVPRVRMQAAGTVSTFLDKAGPEYMANYSDALVTKLLIVCRESLMNHKLFVVNAVLSALTSLAYCLEDGFAKYYDDVMQYVASNLLEQQARSKEEQRMRSKALDCITAIGSSVPEKFKQDARNIAERLKLYQEQALHLPPDDPIHATLQEAWLRVCGSLEKEFVTYLPVVLPAALRTAKQNSEEIVDHNDDDYEEDDDDVETLIVAIKGSGHKRVKINTSQLEDKQAAYEMIRELLNICEEYMFPHIEEITNLTMTNLTYAFGDEIRSTASKCVPLIYNCVKKYIQQNGPVQGLSLVDMFNEFVKRLVNASKKEPEIKNIGDTCESLAKLLLLGETDWVTEESVTKSAPILKQLFDESLKRRLLLKTKKKKHEDDEEEIERLQDQEDTEEDMLNMVMEAIGAYVQTQPRHFMKPFMEIFWPMCWEMLNDRRICDVERRLVLCIFDDFIQYAPLEYIQTGETGGKILQALIYHSNIAREQNLMQSAVYGMGILATRAPSFFYDEAILDSCLNAMKRVIQNPASKETDNEDVTANAVSALYRIMENVQHPQKTAPEVILPIILMALPVTSDVVEARFVHGKIVNLVLQRNPLVMGANNSNLGPIKALFEKVKDTDTVDEETKAKMTTVLGW